MTDFNNQNNQPPEDNQDQNQAQNQNPVQPPINEQPASQEGQYTQNPQNNPYTQDAQNPQEPYSPQGAPNAPNYNQSQQPAQGNQYQAPNGQYQQGYSAPEYNQWNQNQQNGYQWNAPPQPPVYNAPPVGYQQKSRIAAGVLGILFGCFGVHNFYIGKTNRGIAQLLLFILGGIVTCGVASVASVIWGIAEGILILIGSDNWAYDGNGVLMRD